MNPQRMYAVLIAPHVSEKSTMMSEQSNHYAFKVAVDATKREIRQAVESIFDVVVEDLQVLNIKGKTGRSLRGKGSKPSRKKDWKKAYVRLQAGQEIDFAEIG